MKMWTAVLFVMIFISAESADMAPTEVLEKAILALGGRATLESFHSRVASGKVEVAGLMGTYEISAKSPDKVRLALDLGVVKQIRGFDGINGWVQQAGIVKQEGADLERLKRSALFQALILYVDTNAPQKAKLIFPIRGKFLLAGGRDFNEPHSSEWSQHYAYDILGLGPNYEILKDDGKSNADSYSWGKEILAPADGTVVFSRNDVPDNPQPGDIDNSIFMSLPDPMYAVGGNNVVIDHENHEFSLLAHMQKGSVRVHKGDHVKQGDVIGLLGNSGNSDGPHLHYHLMACETIFRCDGLPSRFENVYDTLSGDKLKAPFIKRGLLLEAR